MRPIRLAVRCMLCMAISVTVVCAQKSTAQVLDEFLFAQQTQPPPVATAPQSQPAASVSQAPQPNATQTPSSELSNLETKVRPSVIWVTAFDPKGNLLRTETGFFISADGRFVTTAHAIEGAVNAVAKRADGGVYNVSGVVAVSKGTDLAVLKAE